MVKMSCTSGLCEGTRNSSVRFTEVQSRINCVRMSEGLLLCMIWHVGCTLNTIFMRSGYSRCLVSTKAGQTVRIRSMVSSDAEHSLQDGSNIGLSLWHLDQVKKSPDKNLMWIRNFLQSCVVRIPRSAGCGKPESPDSFELMLASCLRCLSGSNSCLKTKILPSEVQVNPSQFQLDWT